LTFIDCVRSTVPSDNYQARAMIDIALHFNWTYLSLVYSADEYGEMGADTFKKVRQ
jgi:metabotropic glutamate receptor 2/3